MCELPQPRSPGGAAAGAAAMSFNVGERQGRERGVVSSMACLGGQEAP